MSVRDIWSLAAIYSTRAEMNISCDLSVSRMSRTLDMIGFGFRSFRMAKGNEIEEKVKRGLKIRILTIYPDSTLLRQRERDERVTDGQIRESILQLAEWVEKLRTLAPDADNVQIKYYDALPLDFLFRTDDRLFIGPYLYGMQSQQTISYEFLADGKGFDYYMSYFEHMWSEEPDSVPKRQLDRKKPIGVSWELLIHPGETVRDILKDRRITPEELSAFMGASPEYVHNVISGLADISPEFAAEFEAALGVPAYVLLKLQENYDQELLQLTRGLS